MQKTVEDKVSKTTSKRYTPTALTWEEENPSNYRFKLDPELKEWLDSKFSQQEKNNGLKQPSP